MSGQLQALAVLFQRTVLRCPLTEVMASLEAQYMCVLVTGPAVRQMVAMCAHSVLMCFVRFSQNSNNVLHGLQLLLFVMETQCVSHEVATKLPGFSRLVGILSAQWPGFDLKAVHVRFVVDKVALGQVSLPALRLSPAIIIQYFCVFIFFLSGQMFGSWEPSSKTMLCVISALNRKYFNNVLHTVTVITFASLCSACNLRHNLSSKWTELFGTYNKTQLIRSIQIACSSYISM
jgi:hypothetical protein